ncbi:hypothetical protein [Streptomyces sp. NBC_01497]|uniref:hypothetical protein n=1 Tax=Streptomyces sp. NBC_01497 TaxID=2903885 RepID=UPI002E2EE8AA|nr:hypothetical protein [Streptomyces sp. NBC_01497]
MPGIDACLDEAMALPGARGASVVDWTSGLALGTAGESPGGDAEATAAETAELARAAAEYTTFAPDGARDLSSDRAPSGGARSSGTAARSEGGGEGADKGLPVEDVIVSTRTGYHLLCFVETTFDSSVFLHLWLDRDTGNLALARIRMRQLAERLVLG